ncbi:MAG: hypothetical protein JRE71_00355 [Deltaproteobacteria bacterium]|nr:hypothetical protein [Deltaproteobacteria bacterium]
MRSAFIRLGLICTLLLAALTAGYALSSSLGRGAVRSEAETQLAKLLRGRVTIDRADVHIRRGLWIEGRGVRVYPSPAGPGLSAERVAARIDVIALLTGRFRLRDLILDGIHMEIERSVADRWSPYPINAIDKRGQGGDPDDLERSLSAFGVVDRITRVLLESPFIAQRIEITRGSVRLIDRFVRARGVAPFWVRIDSIHGTLVHDWIGNRARLELEGQLSDGLRTRVPIEVFGERRTDGGMDLSVAATKLELGAYRDYFQDQGVDSRRARDAGEAAVSVDQERPFSGVLSGVVRFDTPEPEHGALEIDWSTDQVSMGIVRGEEILNLTSPRVQLRTRLEIHPGRLRISEGELRGPDIRINITGDIERPLRGSSPANLDVHFHDVGLTALGQIINAMPPDQRKPLLRVLERIEGGRIVRVGGSGTERFSIWQAVLRGDRLDLPPGLSMMAEVAGVTIRLGENEQLTDLSGFASWTQDRIHIRRAKAKRNGASAPELNLTIEGFPVLFEETEPFDPGRVSSTGLPGLFLLDDVFMSGATVEDDAASQDDAPVEIDIDIDYLEHSALVLPLRDAVVEAVLLERGQSFHIAKGRWGGAHLSGDVLLTQDPTPTVDAHLKVWAPDPSVLESEPELRSEPATRPPAETGLSDGTNVADAPPRVWAAGRFWIDGLRSKHWPVGPTVASFQFAEDTLDLDNISGRLLPWGNLEGSVRMELSRADQFTFETRFKIQGGHAGRLTEAVGFPNDFATGKLDIEGALMGPIVPGRPAFAEIEGQIEIKGRDGEIRQSIPLVAALTHAAEGFSAARASDALLYESISSVVRFERGSITTDEIKLDGPLRVFLSGRFDFAKPQREIDAEIGIFLFRQVDLLLGSLPLVGSLIPGGKERGLFGAFFEVSGSLEEPVLKAMPMKSLTDGAPLPDLVKAPFSALRKLFRGGSKP